MEMNRKEMALYILREVECDASCLVIALLIDCIDDLPRDAFDQAVREADETITWIDVCDPKRADALRQWVENVLTA